MEEFKERLDQAKEALVCVTFSAKWCGPWRMIKPDVHRYVIGRYVGNLNGFAMYFLAFDYIYRSEHVEASASTSRIKRNHVFDTYHTKYILVFKTSHTESVSRLSHIHGDVEFYEIDVDDNEEIAEARRVACMPTFQFFKRGTVLFNNSSSNHYARNKVVNYVKKR